MGNRNRGFTLIELLIVIAIIVILVVAIAGVIKPRKAGAHELTPSGLSAALSEVGASYRWDSVEHNLVIVDKGTADWADASAACAALKGTVEHLHVTLYSNTGEGELRWEEAPPADAGENRVLTNLPTSSTAEC